MDHIQKSHPLVSNANKQKKSFFVFFELLVVINMEDLFQKQDVSNNKFKQACFQKIRKTVVRKTRQQKILQHFNTSLFQENRVFSYLIIPHTFCKN